MKQKFNTLFFLLSAMCIFYSYAGRAQNIPNADFDSIYIGGIDRVYHWVTSDALYFSNDTVVPFPPDTHYPPQSGNHHFLIRTVQVNYFDPEPEHYLKSVILHNDSALKYPNGSQFNSFICNGDHFYSDSQGFIDFSRGGTPFPYRPLTINGMYKFFDSLSPLPDFGRVVTLLKKWNPITLQADTIAMAHSGNELSPSAVWNLFSVPFIYSDTALPDSIVVIIYSSTNSSSPTSLYIDDIHFDFTTTAPITEVLPDRWVIYPNPCRGVAFITPSPDAEVQFTILNMQGQMVGSGVSADGELNMLGLAPGYYTLLLNENGNIGRVKVIKAE